MTRKDRPCNLLSSLPLHSSNCRTQLPKTCCCSTQQQPLQPLPLRQSSKCLQDQPTEPQRAEPSKKAQMIAPVLRKVPPRAAPQSTAAYLQTAKTQATQSSNADKSNSRLEPSGSGLQSSSLNKSSHGKKQQEAYQQQIQDALREASPDTRIDDAAAQQQSQKRPTSKLAPRRQRPSSPALQDLTDRWSHPLTMCNSHAPPTTMCGPRSCNSTPASGCSC